MSYDNNHHHGNENNGLYSKRLKAGKRRTYFFDVRTTRANDYFLTITESKKRFDDNGYERHKIFLYKEDFNKFIDALGDAVDHVKTELLPDFDFDQFSHENDEPYNPNHSEATAASATVEDKPVAVESKSTEESQVDEKYKPEEAAEEMYSEAVSTTEVEAGSNASSANEKVEKW